MNKKQSNADRIYEDLKKNLTDAHPFRKELITEQNLADQYGVSRTPVREALTRLCSDGYIVKYRSKGYLVKNLDNYTLREQFEFRYFIELGAIQKVVETAKSKDVKALYKILEAPVTSRESIIENNIRFHTALTALSGNESAVKAVESLVQEVRSSIVIYGPSFQSEALNNSHRAILDAIMERDFIKAGNCLKRDILSDLL